MVPYDNVPLGTPPFRYDELNATNTRFDRLVAAPSDRELVLFWTIWAGLLFVVGLFTLIVFLSIITSRKVRSLPFNLYLVFLMVPDLTFSIFCMITCTMNASAGHYWAPWMCKFQSFYITWGVGANAWLNAVIAYQLRKMLWFSCMGRRFTPPTLKEVYIHSASVYLLVAFVSSWSILDVSWIPSTTLANSGAACMPAQYDRASTLFDFLVLFPCFAGIPILYVCWVLYDVFKNDLLPASGKTRIISIYFSRLIGVFILMWIPSLIVMIFVTPYLHPWFTWGAGSWSHLQGAVSAAVCAMKPDIQLAVRQFLFCKCNNVEMEEALRSELSTASSAGVVRINFKPRDTASKSLQIVRPQPPSDCKNSFITMDNQDKHQEEKIKTSDSTVAQSHAACCTVHKEQLQDEEDRYSKMTIIAQKNQKRDDNNPTCCQPRLGNSKKAASLKFQDLQQSVNEDITEVIEEHLSCFRGIGLSDLEFGYKHHHCDSSNSSEDLSGLSACTSRVSSNEQIIIK